MVSPSKPNHDHPRGYLIAIGGSESKVHNPEILTQFVTICGSADARVAVIPTASEADDTGRHYEKVFRELGIRHARVLALSTRAECDSEPLLEYLHKATGVFLTGGSQLRLSTTLGGTNVAQIIRRRHAAGVHVAGTSAGAAFMPEHMIAGGFEGSTPKPDMVTLAPGLGLTNRVIIDQHFRERDRLGRLLTALAYNPFAMGLGLDEDTAAFIAPDDTLRVVGSGGITIVDPSELQYSSMDTAGRDDPVSLIGIRLHILVNGGSFDLATRSAQAGD